MANDKQRAAIAARSCRVYNSEDVTRSWPDSRALVGDTLSRHVSRAFTFVCQPRDALVDGLLSTPMVDSS